MITVLIYSPKTPYEEGYVTCIMIINCGVFGYSINECNFFLKKDVYYFLILYII